MTNAIEEIAVERRRQIEAGRTPDHDDKHRDSQLSRAAACYALHNGNSGPFWVNALQVPQQIWPYRWEWNPKDRRSNLVRAAALIIAEIERLDRDSDRSAKRHDPQGRSPKGESAGPKDIAQPQQSPSPDQSL